MTCMLSPEGEVGVGLVKRKEIACKYQDLSTKYQPAWTIRDITREWVSQPSPFY